MALVFDAKDQEYIVELKVSSEGRRDRLIPLLSQAILQARELAQQFPEPAVPIAVVAARHIPLPVAEQIQQFARRYAAVIRDGLQVSDVLHVWLDSPVAKLEKS